MPAESEPGAYVVDEPVAAHPTFVGRDSLCRTLTTGLAQGRSFTLLGGPKMGTTSVLTAMAPLYRDLWRKSPGATKTVPVYLDATTLKADRPQALARSLWETVCNAVLDARVQSHSAPPRAPKVEFLRTDQPWRLFEESAAQLWEGFRNTSGWCRWVLVIDNAHAFGAEGRLEALDALGALVRPKEIWAAQAWLLGGAASLRALTGRRKELLGGLRALTLSVLRDNDVTTLLRHGGLGASEDELSMLVRCTGKHPYLLQHTLAAWRAAPETDISEIVVRVAASLEPFFERVLLSFPQERVPGEHMLLQLILQSGGEMTATDAERALGVGPIKAPVDFLESAGLIEKVLRGAQTMLRAGCGAWNDWYVEHGPAL